MNAPCKAPSAAAVALLLCPIWACRSPISMWAVHGLKGSTLTCAQHRAGGKTAQAAPGSSSAGLSTSTHAWKSKPHPFHHCCTCGAGWLCGTHTEQSSLLSSQRCALCPWEGSRCADASSNIGNQSTGFHLPQVNPVLFTGCLLHFIFFFPS